MRILDDALAAQLSALNSRPSTRRLDHRCSMLNDRVKLTTTELLVSAATNGKQYNLPSAILCAAKGTVHVYPLQADASSAQDFASSRQEGRFFLAIDEYEKPVGLPQVCFGPRCRDRCLTGTVWEQSCSLKGAMGTTSRNVYEG